MVSEVNVCKCVYLVCKCCISGFIWSAPPLPCRAAGSNFNKIIIIIYRQFIDTYFQMLNFSLIFLRLRSQNMNTRDKLFIHPKSHCHKSFLINWMLLCCNILETLTKPGLSH